MHLYNCKNMYKCQNYGVGLQHLQWCHSLAHIKIYKSNFYICDFRLDMTCADESTAKTHALKQTGRPTENLTCPRWVGYRRNLACFVVRDENMLADLPSVFDHRVWADVQLNYQINYISGREYYAVNLQI